MTEKMELEDAITTAVPVMVIDKYAFWVPFSTLLTHSLFVLHQQSLLTDP